MALATAPMTFTTAAVAASGTSVGPAIAVPDNCHTIFVTNPSSTITVWVGIGAPGAALGAGSAQRVPPATTFPFPLGALPLRGSMDPVNVPNSGLRFDSTGGAITVEITYANQMGPLTGGSP